MPLFSILGERASERPMNLINGPDSWHPSLRVPPRAWRPRAPGSASRWASARALSARKLDIRRRGYKWRHRWADQRMWNPCATPLGPSGRASYCDYLTLSDPMQSCPCPRSIAPNSLLSSILTSGLPLTLIHSTRPAPRAMHTSMTFPCLRAIV